MPRKNVSFDDPIEERAQWLIQHRGFSGLSNLLEVLIREEYERRHPGMPYPVRPGVNQLNDDTNSDDPPDSQADIDYKGAVAAFARDEAARAQQIGAKPKPDSTVAAKLRRAARVAKKK